MAQDPSELVFTLDKKYLLKNNGTPIFLDVIVGDKAQSPDIDIKLNTKTIVQGANASVKNQLVDTDNKLNSKILRITGNVADTDDAGNKIEVTLKLRGGVQDFSKKFSVTVDEEGEEVDLLFIIRFNF